MLPSLLFVLNGLLIFDSFGMAYDFIDCVGDDVDVVSDSEVCIMYNIIYTLRISF